MTCLNSQRNFPQYDLLLMQCLFNTRLVSHSKNMFAVKMIMKNEMRDMNEQEAGGNKTNYERGRI